MQALHKETDFNASGFFTINNSVSYNVKFNYTMEISSCNKKSFKIFTDYNDSHHVSGDPNTIPST